MKINKSQIKTKQNKIKRKQSNHNSKEFVPEISLFIKAKS
jgi:hypothetical protein